MNFVQKYYLPIVLLAILAGVFLLQQSNKYEISSKTIEYSIKGVSKQDVIYQIDAKYIYMKLLGQVLITFSIAMVISVLFVRALEKEERQKLENLTLNVQKETAKDAIESLFNRLIDPGFFKIVKDDLLSAKLIRKDATWKYDITEVDDKLIFKRIITYTLNNISSSSA